MGNTTYRFDLDPEHALLLYQGSLAEVAADALVSSDDNYLSAGSGVSRALASGAGMDVARERQKLMATHRPAVGEVVRTAGGSLHCRWLYHAITLDLDTEQRMDAALLRQLIRNLLARAQADEVRVLGIPALGTGVVGFDLNQAAEIMLEEVLTGLLQTGIREVILALVGTQAQEPFYRNLVRRQADACGAVTLRRLDAAEASVPSAAVTPAVQEGGPWGLAAAPVGGTAEPAAGGTETTERGEEFPPVVDRVRLAVSNPSRPKLVPGLAELIMGRAAEEDIEHELLSQSCCYGFRGTVKQRLMEYLYLGEGERQTALGAALFLSRDLRQMLKVLGVEAPSTQDQQTLVDLVLTELCFNPSTPPRGIKEHCQVVKDLTLGASAPGQPDLDGIAGDAGKRLEQVLSELLRMYSSLFWGAGFDQELVRRNLITARRDGPASARLTIGQEIEALQRLESTAGRDPVLRERLDSLGREHRRLLPAKLAPEPPGTLTDVDVALRQLMDLRNRVAHRRPLPTRTELLEQLAHFQAFLTACEQEHIYPEVMRYDGCYENRHGERFVEFTAEGGGKRKVRTDERIDPRRHYYCFATNNPVSLFPVLVPKL